MPMRGVIALILLLPAAAIWMAAGEAPSVPPHSQRPQRPFELSSAEHTDPAKAASSPRSPRIATQSPIRMNDALLTLSAARAGDDWPLPLPDGRTVTARIDRVEPLPDGGLAGFARLPEHEFGYFNFVRRGRDFVATIAAPALGTFDIGDDEQAQLVIRKRIPDEQDESRRCGLVSSTPETSPDADEPAAGFSPCPLYLSNLAGYDADTNTTVDLMVVYTTAAQTAAGGMQSQIESRIDLAVSNANQAYQNSGIVPRLRVVRKALIAYTETGNATTDLNRLVNPSDGFLDSVHPDRDTYGADLVSLWVANLVGTGGIAYQPTALWPNEDGRNTFSVMRQDNYSVQTLAHEIGHNHGCQHDRPNMAGVGFFPYSYGYREPGAAWHTIMAYPPGQEIPYFSNPLLNYNGPLGNPGPMGVPGEDANSSCDNTRTYNNLAFTIANLRPSTLSSPPSARLYVRATAPGGGNGASWTTAINSAQKAILTAVQSRGVVTEIWIAKGTYKPDQGSNDRLRSFRLPRNVTVYGGFAGTETLLSQRNIAVNPTILSGDIGVGGNSADNSYHVVSGVQLDATAVLDGFTISGGNANGAYPNDGGGAMLVRCGSITLRNCTLTGNSGDNGGAIQVIDSGAPILIDCTISGNSADSGGGLYCYATGGTFTRCKFSGNSAGSGGAILLGNLSTPTLDDCDLNSNSSPGPGAIYAYGSSNAVLTQCRISGNTGDVGGIYLYDSDPTLTNCTFTGNISGSIPGGFGAGGALGLAAGAAPTLTSCTFNTNQAGCCGGAVVSYDGSPGVFDRCTFIANAANFGGAAWCANAGSARFKNCLFFGNIGHFSGGALHTSSGATPEVGGCVFSGNHADAGYGGVLYALQTGGPALRNCTLSRNSASFSGGGLYSADSCTPSAANCILWQNSDGSGQTQAAQITNNNSAVTTVNYSIVQGWNGALGGSGNNNSNPSLRDSDGADNLLGTTDDDLTLLIASPAIDSGRNSDIPAWLTTDAAGNARRSNTGCKADTGVGTPPIVDRGAYEFVGSVVPGDIDGNGTVSAGDLPGFVNVMLKLDLNVQHVAAADINCDGRADGDDVRVFTTELIT